MTAITLSLLEDQLRLPSSPSTRSRRTAGPCPRGLRSSKLPRKLKPPPPPPSRRSILNEPSSSSFSPSSFPSSALKRARPPSDVDGPDTLHASRKKPRLHSRLITSPLSRPFSQPATHFPHRVRPCRTTTTTTAAMATRAVSARGIHAAPSCSYLRFSLMNRLRKRLGIQIHHHAPPAPRDVDTWAQAPWLPDLPDALGLALRPPKSPGAAALPSADQRIGSKTDPALAPTQRRPSEDDIHIDDGVSVDMVDEGDMGEDGFAFLHLEYELRIDDEGDGGGDHVYCDFDAIFGAGGVSSEQGGDHTYEEYMDELDGISWRIR